MPITRPIVRSITDPLTSALAGGGGGSVYVGAADSYRADTAAAAMSFTTPDGFGELVHPSVVDMGSAKWNGKRYWMAATPYHASDSAMENPCIYCADSLDGPWTVPAGLTNPIEAFPGGTDYNSDTHLVDGRDGFMYCIWRQVNTASSSETLYYRRSSDGFTWTDKTLVYTALQSVRRLVSHAIEWDGTQWVMYAVDIVPSPNNVVRLTSPTLTGTWSAPTICTISPTFPTGREAWHLDAKFYAGGIFLLIQDTPTGGSSGGSLYLCRGTDATTFVRPATQAMPPFGIWHDLTYRSCLVPKIVNGKAAFDLVYTGISAAVTYGLGHTSLNYFDKAAYDAEPATAIAGAASNTAPYLIGDNFDRADAAVMGTSTGGEVWTSSTGVPGIASNMACATTAANTRAYLESSSADGYYEEAILHTAALQSYLVVRLSDGSNYWRIGFSAADLVAQKIVAGAATALRTATNAYTVMGSPANLRVGVRVSGSVITVLIEGKVAFSFSDAFNNAATKAGFQTNNTTQRFDNLWGRSLVGGA